MVFTNALCEKLNEAFGIKMKFTFLPLKMVLLRTEISYKGHFQIFFSPQIHRLDGVFERMF